MAAVKIYSVSSMETVTPGEITALAEEFREWLDES